MSKLFSPIQIGSLYVENRIVIPPICQYSAKDGMITNWHLIHYGSLSHSGAGLMILEATAVCHEGRLTHFDLGLWNDAQEESMKNFISSIREYSNMPIAIQLNHGGRKASMAQPWKEAKYVTPENGGWETFAPSSIAFNSNYSVPKELTLNQIKESIESFAKAAIRANNAGIDLIELHAAHGYLMHQFLSPITNHRNDEYGGSFENRIRFVIEVFKAVRAVFPKDKGVGIRISATDWIEGGWNLDESILLAKELEKLGCCYIHVSSGGADPQQCVEVGPNYQIPLAHKIKQEVKIPVISVGLITQAIQAEAIVATNQSDMVAVGRGLLFDPHWPWNAAKELGSQVKAPVQYHRSAPSEANGLFKS